MTASFGEYYYNQARETINSTLSVFDNDLYCSKQFNIKDFCQFLFKGSEDGTVDRSLQDKQLFCMNQYDDRFGRVDNLNPFSQKTLDCPVDPVDQLVRVSTGVVFSFTALTGMRMLKNAFVGFQMGGIRGCSCNECIRSRATSKAQMLGSGALGALMTCGSFYMLSQFCPEATLVPLGLWVLGVGSNPAGTYNSRYYQFEGGGSSFQRYPVLSTEQFKALLGGR